MEKMKLETPDLTAQNIEKIGALFPNCVTETVDENGKPKKAINFNLLRQMLSSDVVEGDEAYAFEGVAPSFDFRFLAALANASIRGLLAHYDVKLVPMEEKPMTDAELDKVMEDNRQQFIEKNINYIAKKEKGSLS